MTVNKQLLKGLTKAVHNHHIIAAFHAEQMHKRDPCSSCELLVDVKLVLKGRVCTLHWLEFDSHISPRKDVTRYVYFACVIVS